MDYCYLLGTAQDAGIPQVGCDCTRCTASRKNPELRRKVSSLGIVLESAGKVYMIDATPDFTAQVDDLRARVSNRKSANPVDGIFITHLHLGHFTGLLQLGRESGDSILLPVYSTPVNCGFLRTQKPFSHLVDREEIELRELGAEAVSIGSGVSVKHFHVKHRNEDGDTIGFTLESKNRRIVYLPDLDEWDDVAEAATREADVAIIDGTFSSREEIPSRKGADVSHPLISETRGRFKDSGVRLIFTHFNHTNPASRTAGPGQERFII